MARAATRNSRRVKAESPEADQAALQYWVVLLVLLVLASGSALGVVYTTYKNRELLNELLTLEKKRSDMQVEQSQLMLELKSQIAQGRLEEVARTELDMTAPALESIVIVTDSGN